MFKFFIIYFQNLFGFTIVDNNDTYGEFSKTVDKDGNLSADLEEIS
jgi:hypothetical protein